MKFLALCSLLLALSAVLIGVSAEPSRDSGGNSWRGSTGPKAQIKQRPFYYDAPIRRPNQPKTMYA